MPDEKSFACTGCAERYRRAQLARRRGRASLETKLRPDIVELSGRIKEIIVPCRVCSVPENAIAVKSKVGRPLMSCA